MNKTHNNDSVCRDDGKYKYNISLATSILIKNTVNDIL